MPKKRLFLGGINAENKKPATIIIAGFPAMDG
jgi:hypothetical protein